MSFRSFLFILVLTCTPAFSQSYYYERFGLDNGLPSDEVYSLFKDSKGYLWIGSNAGVTLYNGSEFKTYNSANGMAGDRIWAIAEDDKRRLFLGCYGNGLSIFDGSKFTNFSTKNGLVSNKVRAFHYVKKRNLMFIGTDGGLSVYDGQAFQNFKPQNKFSAEEVLFSSFIERNDTVFCFTYTGNVFYYYVLQTLEFKTLPPDHVFYKYNTRSCAALSYPSGTIIGTERSGVKIIKDDSVKVFANMGQVFSLAEDNRKQVWAAAWSFYDMAEPGGLFLFQNGKRRHISMELGIKSRFGWAVCFDQAENTLWYATNDNGLYKIKESPFQYYASSFFNAKTLNINAVFADKANAIWIGTDTNIYIFKDAAYTTINNSVFEQEHKKWYTRNFARQYTFTEDPDGSYEKYEALIKQGKYNYPNPFIYLRNRKQMHHTLNEAAWRPKPKLAFGGVMAFGYNRNDEFMVLSGNGLYKLNRLNNPQLVTPVNYSSSSPDFIFDTHNNLHIVGWGWLTISHPQMNYQDMFTPDFRMEPSPTDIAQMHIRGNEVWYAGIQKGLYCCINENFQNFNSSNSSIPNFLSGIDIDRTNKIIVGGNNGHIYISDYINNKLITLYDLSANDGILGSIIHWLVVDSKNNLWFGTNKGLNVINLTDLYRSKNAIIRNFDHEEGLNDHSGKKATIDSSDNLWIIGKDQLIRVNSTQLLQTRPKHGKIQLQALEVNYDPVPLHSEMKFPFDKNTLTFHIEKQNYSNPGKDYFRYKLAGEDEKWSSFSKERQITLNKLSPGKYQLYVESINRSDPSFGSHLTIDFYIMPPFWRTWWFALCIICILTTISYFVYTIRIRKLARLNLEKLEVQQQIHDLEMQALQAQMNPHFTFNALCSVQNYILEKDMESACSFLNQFAKLIRLTLEMVSQKNIYLSKELDYLKTYIALEKQRLSGKFTVEFIIDSQIDPDELRIPPMVIQPMVENAIKHGLMHKKEGGTLKVTFSNPDENSIYCAVEDDGIGRAKAAEISIKSDHNGKGSAITQKRIELFNKGKETSYNIKITDLPNGTRVEMILPVE